MRNKKVVIVTFMIAMIALVQIQISPVLAYQKEETPLYPVSGSDVDDRTFEIDGHLVADGFATAITMDLPVGNMENTHTRVAFAVGLGDDWEEESFIGPIYVWERWTPFVKKMWLKVEGDGDYEPSEGRIVDNTGTGGSSTPDFWTILNLIFLIFDAYGIANFLMEVFQEPPRQEWKPELHSVEAIVRQAETLPEGPRLQTASAWLDSYFKRHGWNTLTITAEAEIGCFYEKLVGIVYTSWVYDVATYHVSYVVSLAVDIPPKTPSTPSGSACGYVGETYSYSTSTTDPEDDNIRYRFDWGDGSTFTTGWKTSGHRVSASHHWDAPGNYHVKVRAEDVYGQWSYWSPRLAVSICSSGGGGPMPCPTLFVWDGSDYNDLGVIDIHADGDVVREVSVPSESVGVNEHKAQFRLREGWEGLTYSHSQIDQVKLHAVDSDGNWRLCPLVEATHSELGNVLPRLLLSDDRRIDLYLLETTDLEFAVPQTNEIQEFVFVIEGCNMLKR